MRPDNYAVRHPPSAAPGYNLIDLPYPSESFAYRIDPQKWGWRLFIFKHRALWYTELLADEQTARDKALHTKWNVEGRVAP